MDNQNSELFREWARGLTESNRDSFSNFFRSTYDRYLRYASRLVGDRNAAVDLVQDAFVSVWNNREGLDPERSLKSYMYSVVRNHCLNFIRDHQNKTVRLEQADTLIIHQEQDSGDPEELLDLLNQLVENLPERQREAFELSRFDGLTHEEIADIMSVSARTVNNHLVAAMKTLRTEAKNIQRSKIVA